MIDSTPLPGHPDAPFPETAQTVALDLTELTRAAAQYVQRERDWGRRPNPTDRCCLQVRTEGDAITDVRLTWWPADS